MRSAVCHDAVDNPLTAPAAISDLRRLMTIDHTEVIPLLLAQTAAFRSLRKCAPTGSMHASRHRPRTVHGNYLALIGVISVHGSGNHDAEDKALTCARRRLRLGSEQHSWFGRAK